MQQWHIGGMFKVRLPDDAGFTVRTATIVRRMKLIDSDCLQVGTGQVEQRCRSESSAPDYDNVARLMCHWLLVCGSRRVTLEGTNLLPCLSVSWKTQGNPQFEAPAMRIVISLSVAVPHFLTDASDWYP
jgi:hypothetical protein